jgi:hypothetical protein
MKFNSTQKYGVTTSEYNQFKGIVSSIYSTKLDIVLLKANRSKLTVEYKTTSDNNKYYVELLDAIATTLRKKYAKLKELYTILDDWDIKELVEDMEKEAKEMQVC